ncbi:histidine kinase dimerization/phosphoacceptor domain-containing protein [Nesterenkonia pannonica]|uniref:sensor histidine kinase n=1 Tax=Nesterenkonia pannonica TaxID=1548602 RepID=UPI0021640CA3|nr:histidine kinase dimerization/phosphoacceptor domain-containing protein [Nesterenkonia pannonica]
MAGRILHDGDRPHLGLTGAADRRTEQRNRLQRRDGRDGRCRISLRLWILSAGRVEAAEASSAQQDRRRQELEERNRIARELHDVVAHSMSVISVQASTAPYRNPQVDEVSRQEFADIAASSRQALSEMRSLLSILRDESEAPTAPEPGIEDIDALIESTRASGAPIDYWGLTEPTRQRRSRARVRRQVSPHTASSRRR